MGILATWEFCGNNQFATEFLLDWGMFLMPSMCLKDTIEKCIEVDPKEK